MKPGNLRLQGAKSGGGNRQMRESCLLRALKGCVFYIFFSILFERNCDTYGPA